MFAMTYEDVKALKPCTDDFHRVSRLLGPEWKTKPVTVKQARKAGCTFDDLIWVASEAARTDAEIEKRLRLFLSDCAAHVLHIYERDETSDAPRKAIIVARKYARGQIDTAARHAARDAARNAARNVVRDAARDAAWAAVGAVAWAAARNVVRNVVRDAARDAAWAAAWAAAWVVEEEWQYDRLVYWLTEKNPRVWPLPRRKS